MKTELERPTCTPTRTELTHGIACTEKICGSPVSPIMCVNQSGEGTEAILKGGHMEELGPIKDMLDGSKNFGSGTEWEMSGREDMNRADSESFSFSYPSGFDAESQCLTQMARVSEVERRDDSGGGGDGESEGKRESGKSGGCEEEMDEEDME